MKSGHEELKDWMERRGFNQRLTAAYFEWDEAYISNLVAGRRTPGLDNAVKIERMTGIPIEAWVSDQIGTDVVAVAESAETPAKSRMNKSTRHNHAG